MLKVTNLSKVFTNKDSNDITAVDCLNFEAKAGEIIAVLGMNGAGKSTTLRMLSSILTPTSGSIELNGQDLHNEELNIRSNIGFLSGSTGLYKRLTARETIRFFAQLNGMSKKDIASNIEKIATLMNMHDFLDRHCEKLSTGQKQKVNIARTIIHQPSLLILDEATTGLDVVAKQSIINFIQQMKNDQRVILFSTHHMDEVEALCEKVIILHKGKLIASGLTSEVPAKLGYNKMSDIFAAYAETAGSAL
ncbi:MAG: ATP-binding cassette domain-containing protein [Lentisphaeraceae bacterium]|nr:ATP-binding cassette domain-containing protein [Lentisphaeraceae bacterium]